MAQEIRVRLAGYVETFQGRNTARVGEAEVLVLQADATVTEGFSLSPQSTGLAWLDSPCLVNYHHHGPNNISLSYTYTKTCDRLLAEDNHNYSGFFVAYSAMICICLYDI